MNIRTAKTFLLLISTVIHAKAIGETANRVLQTRTYNPQTQTATQAPQSSVEGAARVINQQKPVRRVANVNDKGYSNIRTRKTGYYLNPDRATDIRLFLIGGLSNLSSGDPDVQGFRDQQKIGSNYLAGLGADVRLERYFGAELDVYYGIAPTHTIVFDDSETMKKKIQHMGGLLNVKGQYPFYLSEVRVVPKLGVGYGMLMLKQNTESQVFADTIDANETIKGVYGTVGFDVEPISWMVISADYAKSVTANGTYNVKSKSESVEATLDGAQFERLRIGLFIKVHPNVMVGGNYIRRAMRYSLDETDTSPGGDSSAFLDLSSSETVSHIAGTILFQF